MLSQNFDLKPQSAQIKPSGLGFLQSFAEIFTKKKNSEQPVVEVIESQKDYNEKFGYVLDIIKGDLDSGDLVRSAKSTQDSRLKL